MKRIIISSIIPKTLKRIINKQYAQIDYNNPYLLLMIGVLNIMHRWSSDIIRLFALW